MLWLKITNEDEIEIEAKTKINYYKYLMKELIKEKQVWKKRESQNNMEQNYEHLGNKKEGQTREY